jgi:hypothetical protein
MCGAIGLLVSFSHSLQTTSYFSCLIPEESDWHQIMPHPHQPSELDEEGSIWLQPQFVLDQREHHLHQCTIKEVFFHLKDTPLEYATQELTTILQQFPHLNP